MTSPPHLRGAGERRIRQTARSAAHWADRAPRALADR